MFEPTGQSVETWPIRHFDEQRWPINSAISAMVGFVAGVLVATTYDFNDPRVLHNGWVRLASVLVMVGVLIWGATARQGRIRHRIQLCVLLSLLVHLGLAIYLHDRYLVAVAAWEPGRALLAVEEREPHAVIEFRWRNAEQVAVRQEFERPVPVQIPEHEQPAMWPNPIEKPLPAVKPELATPETPRPRLQAARIHRVERSASQPEDQTDSLAIRRPPAQVGLQSNEPIPWPSNMPVSERAGDLRSTDAVVQRQADTVVPAAFVDGPELPSSVVRAARAVAEPRRLKETPATAIRLPLANLARMAPMPRPDELIAPSAEPLPVPGADSSPPQQQPPAATPADVSAPSRHEGGLPVLIAAVNAPGGLDSDRAPLVGIPSRRVRPENEAVHATAPQSVLQRSGGLRPLEGKILEPPAAAFQQRQPGLRSRSAKEHGGSEGTERAVELGLGFLARNQFSDGRWCLDRIPNHEDAEPQSFFAGQMNCDTAATGLSLLAFLGAGYTHLENKHQDTVHRGLQWLVGNQQPNGQLFTRETDASQPARSYGHGIATIALCEAYGMTRDARLREPAQKAIDYILDAQDPRHGGWRYTQPDHAPVWYRESDTSVSGWMVMALKSAQMAGLRVPEDSLHKVSHWLDGAQTHGGALYVYNPHAMLTPDQIRGRWPNRAMTAEGLLMRLYLGWQRDHPALLAGAEYLRSNPPALGTSEQPLRDSYYWYYATQVMFQMQGDSWTTWNDQLQAVLEPSQATSGPLAGSWHPRYPQSDRWAHAGGRLYVTALNLLMLEVYYRHLPLFQTLAK